MSQLKILGLLIAISVIGYVSIGFLLRDSLFRAHTPFTFHQILRIQARAPLIQASSPNWTPLSVEERKGLLSSLKGHTVDWNSTAPAESDLLDSWGTPCLIEMRFVDDMTELRLTSAGPDQSFGTDDDITNSKQKNVE
jgi:hypothetical protein